MCWISMETRQACSEHVSTHEWFNSSWNQTNQAKAVIELSTVIPDIPGCDDRTVDMLIFIVLPPRNNNEANKSPLVRGFRMFQKIKSTIGPSSWKSMFNRDESYGQAFNPQLTANIKLVHPRPDASFQAGSNQCQGLSEICTGDRTELLLRDYPPVVQQFTLKKTIISIYI